MEMPAEDSRVTMGNQTEKKAPVSLENATKGKKTLRQKTKLLTLLLRPWQLPCLSSA